MKDVISVIVPVYNVEMYLPQCVNSILSQDYEALEVILIDDGSTDNSGRLCDELSAQDSRVRVIHQKNGGAAAAKNAGLRVATGKYLSFVDSDDYLEPVVYGYMVSLLEQSQADAAVFAFRDVYRNRQEDKIRQKSSVVSGKEYLLRFTEDWSAALLWNKLYKRSLFDSVFFEEGHKIDDEYFTYQGFMNAETVACDEKIIYNYRRRASSVMLSPASARQMAMDRVDYLTKRRKKVIARFPELREAFDRQYLDALIYLSEDPTATEESIQMLKTCLKDYFREKGHSAPPRYFWKGLLRLYVCSTEKLLSRRHPAGEPEPMENYFA